MLSPVSVMVSMVLMMVWVLKVVSQKVTGMPVMLWSWSGSSVPDVWSRRTQISRIWRHPAVSR